MPKTVDSAPRLIDFRAVTFHRRFHLARLIANNSLLLARKAFSFGSRPMHGRSSNSVARVTRPAEPATKIHPCHVVNNKGPASEKGPAIGAKARLALDLLFTVVQDTAARDRRKAASQAAEFFLPKNARGKKSRRGKFPPDEHGFVVDPELVRELRDSELKLVCLGLEKRRRRYAIAQKARKLQARIKEIQLSLPCPCPRNIRINTSSWIKSDSRFSVAGDFIPCDRPH
jgi:hypothetical protein